MNKRKIIRNILSWFSYSFALPLIPLGLGLTIAYLRATGVVYADLFGGTELFFFSMTILASTKSDLDHSQINSSDSIVYSVFSTLLLPLAALFTATLFGVVYINQNVVDIGLDKQATANYAIITSIVASIVCIPLQVLIAAVNNLHIKQE